MTFPGIAMGTGKRTALLPFSFLLLLAAVSLAACGSSSDSGGGGSSGPPASPPPPAGSLDRTFNNLGYIGPLNFTTGHGQDEAVAVAVDSQGRIVTTGFSTDAAANNNMVAARFTDQGGLDATWNTVGFATSRGAAGDSAAMGLGLAIDSQDGVVVAGIAGTSQMRLWHGTSAGQADPAFGVGGVAPFANAAGGTADYGYAVRVDGQNRLVVAGNSLAAAGGTDLAIWRVCLVTGPACGAAPGALDPSFNAAGTPGVVLRNGTAGGSGTGMADAATGVAIDGQGRIVAVGSATDPSAIPQLTVWRYCTAANGSTCAADGAPDTSFGTGGAAFRTSTVFPGGSQDSFQKVAFDHEGRIVAAGMTSEPTGVTHFVVARLCVATGPGCASVGAPDTSFGAGGIVTSSGTAGTHDGANAVAVDSQDRIVVAGYSFDPSGTAYLAVWRFLPSGAPDPSFNGNGSVLRSRDMGGSEAGTAVTLDQKGRIVVGGQALNATGAVNWWMLWRFNP